MPANQNIPNDLVDTHGSDTPSDLVDTASIPKDLVSDAGSASNKPEHHSANLPVRMAIAAWQNLTGGTPDVGANQGGKIASKVVGYLPNMAASTVETPVEGLYEKATGQPTHVMSDIGRTIVGNAPSGSERLERAGVPKGPSVSDYVSSVPPGSVADISARGTAGTLTDLLSGYLGGSALSKLAKMAGRGMYGSPFKKQDHILSEAGDRPISDILFERGKTPLSHAGIESDIQDTANEIGKERNSLEEPVIASDKTGSMANTVQKMQDYVDTLSSSKSTFDQKLAVRLQKTIDEQLALGEQPEVPATTQSKTVNTGILDEKGNPITRTETVDFPGKSAQAGPTYKEIKRVIKSGYDNSPTDKTTAEGRAYDALYAGGSEEAKSVANQVEPGLGEKIQARNSDLHSLLSSLPAATRKALTEMNKSPLTQVDVMAALADPKYYIGKNLAKYGLMPFQTVGGRALHSIGTGLQTVLPAAAAAGALKNQSPWERAKLLNGGNQ